jgi:molybdopterin-biosynthesis enzyme MoeA-like protein
MPGHPSCPKYRVPSTNTSAMEALIADRGTAFDERGWWAFERQNTFMENLLAQNDLEATFMDGYDLLLTRPDLHIGGRKSDCLHYCLPGPPDVMNQVLLHELKKSWKDASNAIESEI